MYPWLKLYQFIPIYLGYDENLYNIIRFIFIYYIQWAFSSILDTNNFYPEKNISVWLGLILCLLYYA